jgi:crotonobetainyl-CoA:carnitine CoA-transferase CaiB-like acyl-CoA transferase
VTTQPHPVAGKVNVLAPPYRFDGERLPVRSAPPQLGEGTHEVLQSLLGLSDDKLSQLKSNGVL